MDHAIEAAVYRARLAAVLARIAAHGQQGRGVDRDDARRVRLYGGLVSYHHALIEPWAGEGCCRSVHESDGNRHDHAVRVRSAGVDSAPAV